MKIIARPLAYLCTLLVCSLLACEKGNISEVNLPQPQVEEEGGKNPLDPGFVENDVVMYWNEKTALVLGAPMTQPARTRYFAIIEIAVHDALNAIKPKYERFSLTDVRSQFASPDAAVASAAYWAIKGLNRQGTFPVDTWYNESLSTIEDGESKTAGIALGKAAAESIIAKRANDGFTQVISTSASPADGVAMGSYRSTLRFVPINGVPTLTLAPLKYIPNWGTVLQPYVVNANTQFRPQQGPYELSDARYAADYQEVKEKGARTGSTRTPDEEQLTKFWAESRPSLIWNTFTRGLIGNKKMDAWKTARLFALVHTGMADGINTVMESKYYFYAWRPETAIRLGDSDDIAATVGDAQWLPFITEVPNAFVTPPVPEYPCSYAMYGGVAASILRQFFGTDNISVDLTSASLPGVVLHYASISKAARDNSITKIYAGWYFRRATLAGEEMGEKIGTYVMGNQFREE